MMKDQARNWNLNEDRDKEDCITQLTKRQIYELAAQYCKQVGEKICKWNSIKSFGDKNWRRIREWATRLVEADEVEHQQKKRTVAEGAAFDKHVAEQKADWAKRKRIIEDKEDEEALDYAIAQAKIEFESNPDSF